MSAPETTTPELPAGLKAWFEYGWTYTRPDGRRIDERGPAQRYVTAHVVTAERDGRQVAKGTAVCSHEDQFVKQVGRDIALERALSTL